MNKIIRVFSVVAFSFFIISPSFAANGEYTVPTTKGGLNLNNLISMDFQDANLKTVLKLFSQQSGLNFVASQSVQDRTVTIYFDSVTVEDALNHIMNANNLTYEQEPGSNIFIVKESGKSPIETLTKIYELEYAQLFEVTEEGKEEKKEPEILSVLKNLLSEKGTIVAEKRSNSLIIKDIPSQFAIIENVLSRLDIRTQQVMIEAEILETTTNLANKLGISWGTSGTFAVYTGPVHNTIWPLRGIFGKDTSMGEGISETGTFSLSNMTATLKAIKSDTDTKILARPKVLTLNNETATIKLTAETAVASTTVVASSEGATTQATATAERIDTGITLKVTPQINKDGHITMRIQPEVIVPVISEFFAGTGSDAKFVDPQTRSVDTTVMVKDGETVIIGGLISKEDTNVFNKVPFLGDIPLLGLAFRYKTTDEVDKELLIFITPHVVKDSTYVLGSISEREQEKPKAVREREIKDLLDLFGG